MGKYLKKTENTFNLTKESEIGIMKTTIRDKFMKERRNAHSAPKDWISL